MFKVFGREYSSIKEVCEEYDFNKSKMKFMITGIPKDDLDEYIEDVLDYKISLLEVKNRLEFAVCMESNFGRKVWEIYEDTTYKQEKRETLGKNLFTLKGDIVKYGFSGRTNDLYGMYKESGCMRPFSDVLRIRGQLEWERACGLYYGSITKEMTNLLMRNKVKDVALSEKVIDDISDEDLKIFKETCQDLKVSTEDIDTPKDLPLVVPKSVRDMCKYLNIVLDTTVRSLSCKKELEDYGICPQDGFEYEGIKYRLLKDLYEDYGIPYSKEDLKRDLDGDIISRREYLGKILAPLISREGYKMKPFIVGGVEYCSKYLFLYGVLKFENDYDRYYYYNKIEDSKLEFSTAVERDYGFYIFGSLYFSIKDVIRDYEPIIGSYNDRDSLYKRLIAFSGSLRSKEFIIEDYIRLKAYNINVKSYSGAEKYV